MKKILFILISILIILGVSTYIYWQFNKHQIVKNLIVHSVSDYTDSLYLLQYDSSKVDEVSGEAYFRNISFKVDSIKFNQLKRTHLLPNIVLEFSIQSIQAKGIDIALAVNDKSLFAKEIIINNPRITIYNTGETNLKKEDSIALFRKILGDYKRIHAEHIEIKDAIFISKNPNGKINTSIKKLSMTFQNIVVDSTKDYKNVICYFIENMNANVEEVYIADPNKQSAIVLNKISFNSSNKKVTISKIKSIKEEKNEEQFELNNLELTNLNVKEFINNNSLSVGNISSKNCMLILYLNKKEASKMNLSKFKNFDFPDDYFDKIKIGGISIEESTLLFKSKTEPDNSPIRVNGFSFKLSQDMNITERSSLRSIIDNATWIMQARDFEILSKDKKYIVSFVDVKIDKGLSNAFIQSIKIKPTKNLVETSQFQQDIYNVEMRSIQLMGINLNTFINESSLNISEVSMNVNLKVYHDRIPTEQPETKVGKYPHQLLLKIPMSIDIQKLILKNSLASYTERSKETKQDGTISFTNIESEIKNITNNADAIRKNPICKLNASGLLLGKSTCTSDWRLFLNSSNGKFEIDGNVGGIRFEEFNSLTKPLALTTIEGQLNSIKFSLKGNDLESNGDMILLYNNLKLSSFKFDQNTTSFFEKKSSSKLNNLFAKNNNPTNGITRHAKFTVQRDIHKSFFNLMWKSAYDGIQNTILNKNVAEIKKQLKTNK